MSIYYNAVTESEAALHEAAKNNDVVKIKKLLIQKVPERVDVNCRNNVSRVTEALFTTLDKS